jgi:hypothetical protein
MASTTSRGHNHTHSSFTKISLFKTLLPSLLCTLDCGFTYVFVMGYDQGDEFYDSPAHMTQVRDWFAVHIAHPLRRQGILISLHPVLVQNPTSRPGPAFTAIAQAAYTMGADFFYRVNDDSQFIGRWANLYTQTLLRLTPPYGVIGPSCYDAKDRILTHDFVHRTHMDLFKGLYYPTEFSDWYMDDWISAVYGPQRTFLSTRVGIDHHNRFRERTYDLNRNNVNLLAPLIKSGQQKILQWMRVKAAEDAIPQIVVTAFEKDIAVAASETGKKEGGDATIIKYQEIF